MSDCLFCKIINKEIPANIVYEDEKIFAMHDISPMAPVHVLVLPKVHIESLNELTSKQSEYVTHAFLKIPDICEQLRIKSSGYRLVVNTGNDGGQTVKHLHIHILGGTKLPDKMV